MATRAGQSTTRFSTTLTTNAHNARSSTNASTVDPGTSAGDGGDQTFEVTTGGSIVVHTDLNVNAGAPTTGDIKVWVEALNDNVAAAEGAGFNRSVQVISLAGGFSTGLHAGTDVTFFATADGTSSGSIRAGTYRIRTRVEYAQVTTDAVNGGYKGDSDGNFATTGTPNTWSQAEADKGYYRGGITITAAGFTYSAISAGGAAPTNNTFTYPQSEDFQLIFTVFNVTSSSTTNMTLDQLQASSVVTTDTGTSTGGQITWARAGAVGGTSGINNTFPSAATNTQVRITIANSTLSGQPWTHFSSGVPGSWTQSNVGSLGTGTTRILSPSNLFVIDPRVTFSQLFQLNSNTFATPPTNNNQADSARCVTDYGQIAWRAVDANGVGIQNVAWTQSIWDNLNLTGSSGSPTHSNSVSGTTQGGQTGWSTGFLTFTDTSPSGTWNTKAAITSAHATGLEVSNTSTVILLASDNRIQMHAHVTNLSRPGANFMPGDHLRVTGYLFNTNTGIRIAPDSSTSSVSVTHYNSNTDRARYLNSSSDDTTSAFTTWAAASAITTFTLSVNGSDANLFEVDFTNTDGWPVDNLEFVVTMKSNSTPYTVNVVLNSLGASVRPAVSSKGYAIRSLRTLNQ